MTKSGNGDPLLLRVKDAGDLCGIPRSTAYELAHTEWRQFTICVHGNSLRVLRAGLEAWIEAKLHEKAAGVDGQGGFEVARKEI